MNQRIRKAKDRKDQNLDRSTMSTGGHVVSHGRGTEPVVHVPQKVTGDVSGEKTQGLAKASPFFKPVEEVSKLTKAQEKKALAENEEKKTEDQK